MVTKINNSILCASFSDRTLKRLDTLYAVIKRTSWIIFARLMNPPTNTISGRIKKKRKKYINKKPVRTRHFNNPPIYQPMHTMKY